MRKVIIDSNNANQRLDKFLVKYLPQAPKSFIYKMIPVFRNLHHESLVDKYM